MIDLKKKIETKKVDTKEFEIPETLYVRDIENRVFQGIVLQCLSRVEGIALVEGNFIDNIFDRGTLEGIKGIYVEQDNKNRSVNVKIEVNVCYGCSIPEKAEEIQTLCTQEITKLTGLHVSNVHIVFKNVITADQLKKEGASNVGTTSSHPSANVDSLEDEYNDEF